MIKDKLHQHWTAFDYDHLLPFLARLPVKTGRQLATWRGWIYALIERDWRRFCLGDDALHQRLKQAFRELLPGADEQTLRKALRQRYVAQSLDELEACQLARRDLREWSVQWVGLEAVQESIESHGKIVFVTSHFASCVLGVVLLEQLGIPVLAMTSNITEDPRVHRAVRDFYRRRKQHGDTYLNGGEVLFRQGNTRQFVKFLERGGAVVIFGDLPPDTNESALLVDFLGKKRAVAAGASRLAELVNAPLMSFICERKAQGYELTFSQPGQCPYKLLEMKIAADPAAWWAADLLPLLPIAEE